MLFPVLYAGALNRAAISLAAPRETGGLFIFRSMAKVSYFPGTIPEIFSAASNNDKGKKALTLESKPFCLSIYWLTVYCLLIKVSL